MKNIFILIFLMITISKANSQTKVFSNTLDSLSKATGKVVLGYSKSVFKNKDNTFRETIIIFWEDKKREMQDSILGGKIYKNK